MRLDTQDRAFAAQLRGWLAHLDDEVIVSFRAVLDVSPGYYPTTVHDLWAVELRRRGLVIMEEPAYSLAATTSLPVGHPLDYDWRFSPETRASLLRQILSATAAGGTLAYLGTPTLFAEASETAVDRQHVLLDANSAMVRALQAKLGPNSSATELRIGEGVLPDGLRADVVVLDPPWYPSDTVDFVAAAASLLRPGGTAFLSQPTIATRPGVEAERRSLVDVTKGLGFEIERSEQAALRYLTPHFERMSLTTEEPGLRVTDDWRRGDLMVLRRQATRLVKGSTTRTRAANEVWHEVSFGPVRVKLRAAGGTDLGRVAPGLDRLTTVSRRDPARSRVGVWTSGNRVRTLQSLDRIVNLIALCENDLKDMAFTHSKTRLHAEGIGFGRRVADDLFDLLLLEYQEHVAGGYGVLL